MGTQAGFGTEGPMGEVERRNRAVEGWKVLGEKDLLGWMWIGLSEDGRF